MQSSGVCVCVLFFKTSRVTELKSSFGCFSVFLNFSECFTRLMTLWWSNNANGYVLKNYALCAFLTNVFDFPYRIVFVCVNNKQQAFDDKRNKEFFLKNFVRVHNTMNYSVFVFVYF